MGILKKRRMVVVVAVMVSGTMEAVVVG